MAVHRSHRSVLSLKSWLFTPATNAYRFGRAAEVHADALIIDLEDAVALSDKQKARTAALQYLEQPPGSRLPGALRINAPVTRTGIEDLHSLLESSAALDYIILPKCDSPAFISMVRVLLDQAAKKTEISPSSNRQNESRLYASKEGMSFIAFQSAIKEGKISKIVPRLSGPVPTPRTDVHYVVTENGVANLKGLSSTERAQALIALAHPAFQDELTAAAKENHLL